MLGVMKDLRNALNTTARITAQLCVRTFPREPVGVWKSLLRNRSTIGTRPRALGDTTSTRDCDRTKEEWRWSSRGSLACWLGWRTQQSSGFLWDTSNDISALLITHHVSRVVSDTRVLPYARIFLPAVLGGFIAHVLSYLFLFYFPVYSFLF